MESAKVLIMRVAENRERVAALEAEAQSIVRVSKEKEASLEALYKKEIKVLELEFRQRQVELKAKRKADYLAKLEEVESVKAQDNPLKRTLAILRLQRTDLPRGQSLEIGGTDSVGGGSCYTEGYIINFEFYKAKLFIVASGQTTQAGKTLWTLCALGKSYFPGSLFALPPKTRVPFPTQGQYQVECALQVGTSVAELRTWLDGNKEVVKAQLLGEYPAIEAEYLATLANYKPEDFSPLITMVCKVCSYFVHSLDDVTPGKTCPRCQKALTAWPEPEAVWPNR